MAVHHHQVYTSFAVISKRMSEKNVIRKRFDTGFLEKLTKWTEMLKSKLRQILSLVTKRLMAIVFFNTQ